MGWGREAQGPCRGARGGHETRPQTNSLAWLRNGGGGGPGEKVPRGRRISSWELHCLGHVKIRVANPKNQAAGGMERSADPRWGTHRGGGVWSSTPGAPPACTEQGACSRLSSLPRDHPCGESHQRDAEPKPRALLAAAPGVSSAPFLLGKWPLCHRAGPASCFSGLLGQGGSS